MRSTFWASNAKRDERNAELNALDARKRDEAFIGVIDWPCVRWLALHCGWALQTIGLIDAHDVPDFSCNYRRSCLIVIGLLFLRLGNMVGGSISIPSRSRARLGTGRITLCAKNGHGAGPTFA